MKRKSEAVFKSVSCSLAAPYRNVLYELPALMQ
jgi:hypothetical protein